MIKYKRQNRKWALVFCATAAILLPAHPSLQETLIRQGIPSWAVSLIFALPVFYELIFKGPWLRQNFKLALPIFIYITWMGITALYSPSLGQSSQVASLKSLFILIPLALICGRFAATNKKIASYSIALMSLIAVIHYTYIFLSSNADAATSGFRSLAGDAEKQNYQSTSFYFGFLAIFLGVLAVKKSGIVRSLCAMGIVAVFFLMGTVGARSSAVAILATLILIVHIESPRRRTLKIVITLLVVTLAGVAAWLVVDNSNYQGQLVLLDRFVALADEDDSSKRVYLFSEAVAMWLNTGWNVLFGGGLGSFPNFIRASEKGMYPHNFILESLAEGGVIAGVLLMWCASKLKLSLYQEEISGSISGAYIYALSIYSLMAFQFMGGISSFWQPMFFVAILIYSKSVSCNIPKNKIAVKT